MAEAVDTIAASVWRRQLQRITAGYSLIWLLAANLVGLWLALLLLWPDLGTVLGGWTYGRWMPLHMDWQLYGWCALPLVGLLLSVYLAPRYGSRSTTCMSVFSAGRWLCCWAAGSACMGR